MAEMRGLRPNAGGLRLEARGDLAHPAAEIHGTMALQSRSLVALCLCERTIAAAWVLRLW